jgi:hypothetical protein
MRYKAVYLIVAALILSLAAACSSTGGGGSLDLVPQRADAVGHLDVSRLLSDSDLIRIYDALPKDPDNPQTFEAALDSFQGQTGIDPRAFDDLFIFGDTATSNDDTGYVGAIGTGTFDTAGFINSIEDAADVSFVTTTHEGYDVYVDENADAAVAFLDENTVVIGTIEAVTDVLDVKAGKGQSMGGEVVNTFDGLGTVLAKFAASAKEVATEEALQGANETLSMPIPIDLSSLADAQMAGFTFSRDGQSITAQLKVSFSNSSSAKDAKGLVSMVKAFVSTYGVPEGGVGNIQLPEEDRDLLPEVLANVKAEVDGSDLTITLTMTLEEIDQLLSQGSAT